MKRLEEIQSYDDYKNTQIERSVGKWGSVSFNEFLFYKVMMNVIPQMTVKGKEKLRPKKIICLGIRKGNEFHSFNRLKGISSLYQKSKVFGVDINPEVVNVSENCFDYDFNNLPKEWANSFNLLYSNSLDHSHDIKKTITEWYRIVPNNGFMILTLSTNSKGISKTDIYSFEMNDIDKLFSRHQFRILDKWKEYGQNNSFNVLLKVIK